MRRRGYALLLSLMLPAGPAFAHEGNQAGRKPTKAARELKAARVRLDSAKKKLTSQGKYACCVKPACDLCARANGSCACALNLSKGLGVCGECQGGWAAGRGAIKGVDGRRLSVRASNLQALAADGGAKEELREVSELLMQAKRTLISEKRYGCCIRGGCDECAFEGDCPCGADLASTKGKPKGVCGQCVDGWHAGKGALGGVTLAEVRLAPMGAMSEGMERAMSPGVRAAGWYASGTSQMPRSSPMFMVHRRAGDWTLMLSAMGFLATTQQSGPQGGDKTFAANWIMPMAGRKAGPGFLTLRSMFSLEPATVTGRRYPLLFQTGETAFGRPIVNGQHPHDFVMELGASYQIRLSERVALNFYGGPRGEPAFGPTAYPHRLSASENPLAVLGHHYQDSTHIATNVVTAGVTAGKVTFEASGFHGAEPDERRWNLETGRLNSYAARVTVNPALRWSTQFSYARISGREALHPEKETSRTSASATYLKPLSGGHWASTVLWGRNVDREHAGEEARSIYNSYLAESTVFLRRKHWIWGRIENTDKDSALRYTAGNFPVDFEERPLGRVLAVSAGYARELPRIAPWLSTALGTQLTVYRTPDTLRQLYGGSPVGAQVFLRVRLDGLPR